MYAFESPVFRLAAQRQKASSLSSKCGHTHTHSRRVSGRLVERSLASGWSARCSPPLLQENTSGKSDVNNHSEIYVYLYIYISMKRRKNYNKKRPLIK